MADKPSYFITTPIYYVNAAPHLAQRTALFSLMCRHVSAVPLVTM